MRWLNLKGRDMRRLPRVSVLVAVCIVCVLALAGCSGGGTAPPTSESTAPGGGSSSGTGKAVAIGGMVFSPESVEIKAGDSVTWTNNDSASHIVTGQGRISSNELGQGDTYSKTFDAAGTYDYRCSIHPDMTGKVIVKQ